MSLCAGGSNLAWGDYTRYKHSSSIIPTHYANLGGHILSRVIMQYTIAHKGGPNVRLQSMFCVFFKGA